MRPQAYPESNDVVLVNDDDGQEACEDTLLPDRLWQAKELIDQCWSEVSAGKVSIKIYFRFSLLHTWYI